jgi:uncharacterized protein (DUF1800 family)
MPAPEHLAPQSPRRGRPDGASASPASPISPRRRPRRALLGAATLAACALFTADVAVAVSGAAPAPAETVGGGVFYNWYAGRFSALPDFDALTPSGYGVAPGFSIDTLPQRDDFAVRYTGYLSIPEPGEYRFYTRSDDGSELLLDGERIVDNDGLHGMRTRWSQPLLLAAGDYPITVGFFEATGHEGLEVGFEGPDGRLRQIDPGLLAFDAAQMPQPHPAEDTADLDLYPGVAYGWYAGRWDRLPDFAALTPDFLGVADGFDSGVSLARYRFALRFQAYIEVPEDGIYTFYTSSDDGSALYVGDRRVVDNDGLHGPRERAGAIALAAGLHRITVDLFQDGGGELLDVVWSGPGFTRAPIAAEALSFALDMLPPLREPVTPDEDLLPGLAYRYSEGNWDSMPDLDAEAVLEHGVIAVPGLEPRMATDRYAFSYRGYIEVPADGVYAFTLASNAPAKLWIGADDDAELVAELDKHRSGQQDLGALPLAAGVHPIRIDYFERWGGDLLSVSLQGPGDDSAQPLPAAALFHSQSQLPAYLAAASPDGGLTGGLAYTYYEGDWRTLDAMQPEQVRAHGIVDGFRLDPRETDDKFGFVFDGWIDIDQPGFHRFFTNSDDGSRLWIGDALVVDNDGLHGPQDAWGSVGLEAGLHRIRVAFFERWGGETLTVRHAPPGAEPAEIPLTRLGHSADQLPSLIAALPEPADLSAGLAYAFAKGDFKAPPDFATLEPSVHGVADGLDLGVAPTGDKLALKYTGFIRVPQAGFYRFFATADDGAALVIAGQPVLVGSRNREAFGSLGLEAGLHAFELVYHQRWGDKALALSWQLPDGTAAAIPATAFSHTTDQLPALTAAVTPDGDLAPGLAYRQYEGSWSRLPDFATLTPTTLGVSPVLDLARATTDRKLGLRFDGYLRVPERGFYRLHLTSDDGSRLWLGDELIVDNDGQHGPREIMGAIGLEAGLHPIRVDFFQSWGGMTLALEMTGPDGVRVPVAAADLFHTADQLPALRAAAAAPDAPPVSGALPGLAYDLYLGQWSALPDFAALTPDGVGIATAPDLAGIGQTDKFGVRYRGWLRIDAAGWYDFRLGSDDGSRLLIGDTLVIDNDGLHGYREVAGAVGLEAGWHPIEVQFFERHGDERLTLALRGPAGDFGPLPADALMLDPALLPDLQDAGANAANLIGGVDYAYYEGRWSVLPDFAALTPVATGVVDSFTLAPRLKDDNYGFVFNAYIDIPEYGHYEFCTRSDDGSKLYIGDTEVVDNDGLHAARTRCGRIGLDRGRHAIRVTFFERGGDDSLEVTYSGPRFGTTAVTADVLFRIDPAIGEPGTAPDGGPISTVANADPTPAPDIAGTGIGQGQSITVAVLANDSDPDGDILVLTGADSATAAGAAVVAEDGRRLVYTPPLGFVGTDAVSYSVGDRRGGSAYGTLTVEVGAGVTPVMTAEEAVRFLNQATFGATRADIATVMLMGPEAWIDAQLALPASGHEGLFDELRSLAPNADNRQLRINAWLRHAVGAPDQLRQRMAFALSQIFVVGDLGNVLATDAGALGAVHYYDMLVDGAFGPYRTLLEGVTLHPAMGFFLDSAGNVKEDPITGTVPDENYAREVLQLFSIGLWELLPNGEQLLDADGKPIPSYTGEDIMQYARVFTGWDYATEALPDKWRLPMVLDLGEHEQGEKRLLDPAVRGQLVVIPADLNLITGDPTADLAWTLDNIAAHRNVAPFIGRQLIQRFVTSNPSPDYVGRVADAFRNSGGDLGETIRAVLLDQEARTGTPDPLDGLFADAEPGSEAALPRAFGKVKEPLLQLTGLWRALGIDPDETALTVAELAPLGQVPLSAPSVFNFFQPDYQAPGEIAALGLDSPELQIITEQQITGAVSIMDTWTLGATQNGADWYDLSMELAMADSGAAKIVEHLSLLFLGGEMSDTLREVLYDQVFYDYDRQGESGRLTRVLAAVYLIVTSPEYLIEE